MGDEERQEAVAPDAPAASRAPQGDFAAGPLAGLPGGARTGAAAIRAAVAAGGGAQLLSSLQRATGNRAVAGLVAERPRSAHAPMAAAPAALAAEQAGRQALARAVRRRSPRALQRQEDGDRPAARLRFSVRVTGVLGRDALLLEFIKQYRNLATDAEAEQLRVAENWHWLGAPQEATAADVRKGYVLVSVSDNRVAAATGEERESLGSQFSGLSTADRQALNAETDRLFWERTRYRQGQPLGHSADDRSMYRYWMDLRYDLLRQRQAIASLPADVRAVLFDGRGGRPVEPRDYPTILRLAERLAGLSPLELSEYRSRVSATTTDFGVLEGAIGRFEQELRERRTREATRGAIETRLTGLEALYRRYKAHMSAMTWSAALPPRGGGSLGSVGPNMREHDALDAEMRRRGFAGIGGFEEAIHAYERAFRDEAVALSTVLLDRYEHVLFEHVRQFGDDRAATALYDRLGDARAAYEEGDRIRDEYLRGGGPAVPWTLDEQAAMSEVVGRRNAARARADALVRAQATDAPALANRDFDREAFARGGRGQAQRRLLDYARDRRSDIARSRRLIAEKPDRIFGLDDLLRASFTAQGVAPDSIFGMIVRDHATDLAIVDAIPQVLLGIVAVAAGLLTAGGGTVAVLAAGTAFGIGSYQAYEEFRRYEERSALHGAGLLSDDPSIAWAIVALVGAGLDFAAVAAALSTVRTGGSTLRAAITAYNETGDITKLARELEQVDKGIRTAVLDAAQAQAEARAAWRSVIRPPASAVAYSDPFLIRALWGPSLKAVWMSMRAGVRRFQLFLRTQDAVRLFGTEFAALAPEVQTAVRTLYQRVTDVVRRGEQLGMRTDEIDRFLRLWADNPALTAEEITRQIERYAEPLTRNARARYRIASDTVMDAATRRFLSDFDQRIASTGGITRITAGPAADGRMFVRIEGELQPRLVRRAADAEPGQVIAPNFNADRSNLRSLTELGLGEEWQRLHLWGPGFGDEAAAGMMIGPKAVNQEWQNRGIEGYIRAMRDQARREGGKVRVTATATAWENPTPRGFQAPGGELFLKRAEYVVVLEVPGKPNATMRISIDCLEPPASGLAPGGIDLLTPTNLGALLPTP